MTTERRTVERVNLLTHEPWPSGPWDDEPDELDFGFGDVRCRIVRHPHFGHLNGYIAVPPSHPWYGKGYDDLVDVEVHGEITFAGVFDDATYATADGQADWWIGFDCAHAFDRSPGMSYAGETSSDLWSYKDMAYVRCECEHLARQAMGER